MLRNSLLNNIKKACVFSFLPRIWRGHIINSGPGRFQKPTEFQTRDQATDASDGNSGKDIDTIIKTVLGKDECPAEELKGFPNLDRELSQILSPQTHRKEKNRKEKSIIDKDDIRDPLSRKELAKIKKPDSLSSILAERNTILEDLVNDLKYEDQVTQIYRPKYDLPSKKQLATGTQTFEESDLREPEIRYLDKPKNRQERLIREVYILRNKHIKDDLTNKNSMPNDIIIEIKRLDRESAEALLQTLVRQNHLDGRQEAKHKINEYETAPTHGNKESIENLFAQYERGQSEHFLQNYLKETDDAQMYLNRCIHAKPIQPLEKRDINKESIQDQVVQQRVEREHFNIVELEKDPVNVQKNAETEFLKSKESNLISNEFEKIRNEAKLLKNMLSENKFNVNDWVKDKTIPNELENIRKELDFVRSIKAEYKSNIEDGANRQTANNKLDSSEEDLAPSILKENKGHIKESIYTTSEDEGFCFEEEADLEDFQNECDNKSVHNKFLQKDELMENVLTEKSHIKRGDTKCVLSEQSQNHPEECASRKDMLNEIRSLPEEEPPQIVDKDSVGKWPKTPGMNISPTTQGQIQDVNVSDTIVPMPNIEDMPLSQLLKLVRQRNAAATYRSLLPSTGEEEEESSSKCKKGPDCPPPNRPKPDPPADKYPPTECGKKTGPCPQPHNPNKPCEPCCPKPKDPCFDKPKDPCFKNFSTLAVTDNYRVGVFGIKAFENLPLLPRKEIIQEGDVKRMKLLLGDIVVTRGFDPWTPIPSWPIPRRQAPRIFRCPHFGCPYPPPIKDGQFCDPKQKPCPGFPKRPTFAPVDSDIGCDKVLQMWIL